jgi:hypothetical protein
MQWLQWLQWLFSHMDDHREHGTTFLLAFQMSGRLDIDNPIPSAGISHKSAYVPFEERLRCWQRWVLRLRRHARLYGRLYVLVSWTVITTDSTPALSLAD